VRAGGGGGERWSWLSGRAVGPGMWAGGGCRGWLWWDVGKVAWEACKIGEKERRENAERGKTGAGGGEKKREEKNRRRKEKKKQRSWVSEYFSPKKMEKQI
jgi:hypothetical protein